MPKRIFVGTSFVLALINERDQYHDQAEALSGRFENSPLVMTDAVLLEIGNTLAKGFRGEAVEVFRALRSSKRVEVVGIDGRLFEKGLEIHKRHGDKTWGLVDCISFVVMREGGVTEVLTFHEDFTQAGFIVGSSQ